MGKGDGALFPISKWGFLAKEQCEESRGKVIRGSIRSKGILTKSTQRDFC
jgi:hypothetical protein